MSGSGLAAPVFVALLLAAAGPAAAADGPTTESQATGAAARRILDAWHAEAAVPGDRRLHVVAWRAKDREFAADHRARLDRILTHIQAFYRSEMERHGLGPRSIRLDRNPDGSLIVHDVTGEATFADYGRPDGNRIRAECAPVLREKGIDIDRETVLVFTNLADWDPQALTFRHKSPYYGGGGQAAGIAFQLDSPELDVTALSAREPMILDGEYGRISLGRHASIFIGGIAHELGHALGLPHSRERADEAVRGTALMGSGNRTYGEELRAEGKGSFLTLADALRLASHPQFSGSIKGMRDAPQAEFSELDVALAADRRSFTITGRVTGTPPIYALVGYLDPAGNAAYDARSMSAVPDADGRFALPCAALERGRAAELRLVACHANGATTTRTYPYTVAEDGTVDAEAVQVGFQLDGFLTALDRGGSAAAGPVADSLPADSLAARIAAAVLAGGASDRATVSPVAAEGAVLPLSRATPLAATVGWHQPAYDRLPRRDAVVTAGGRVFETGIYAHAPARHRYDLGGRWQRLRGDCGVAAHAPGSVEFVIRLDGREVFRSGRLDAGQLRHFDIEIGGSKDLELAVDDAGDGSGGDWGVWLAPELVRGVR